MDTRLTSISIVIAITFMVLVVSLIRRGYLSVRYSLLWFLAALIIIILALFPKILNTIALILGILIPANALFFTGFLVVIFILLALTVSLSRLSKKNTILSQEIAILKAYIKELEKKIANTLIQYETGRNRGNLEKD